MIVEQVLVMTVNPGFGMHFLPTNLREIRRARDMFE